MTHKSLSIAIVLLSAGFIALVKGHDHQLQEQTPSEENWMAHHYRSVAEAALVTDPPKEFRWIITASIFSESDSEFGLTLIRTNNGGVLANAKRPKEPSLNSLVKNLRRAHPQESPEQLSRRVCVYAWSADDRLIPGLKQLAAEVERMRFPAIPPNELMLHPDGYDVRLKSYWGNELRLMMDGPGRRARRQPHALIDWVERLRRLMESNSTKAVLVGCSPQEAVGPPTNHDDPVGGMDEQNPEGAPR